MNSHDAIPYVNLIPADQIARRVRAIWVSRWVFFVGATTLFVGVPGLYIGGSAALTDSGMTGQIHEARSDYAKHQQAIPLLQSRLNLLNAKQEVLDLVKNRIDWRDVFGVLVEAAGSDVRFTSLAGEGGGVEGEMPISITVRGIAPTQTAARAFVVEIESTGHFDRVELIDTTRREIDDHELIAFELRITVLSTQQPEPGEGGSANAG